jgi:sialic acid synthase
MMEKRAVRIGDFEISDSSKAYVIAEIGHNHQGSLKLCKDIIEAAATCGVSAVKLQKRDNRRLYTPEYFNRPYSSENSFGETYGAHREFLEFDRSQYLELKEFSNQHGLDFFATAFDFASVDFLYEIGVPAIKIASGDLRSVPLIKYAMETGVPVIISTGASSIDDVQFTYDELSFNKRGNFSLLQCTAIYPAVEEQLHLNVITSYRKLFKDTVIGFSSHDKGIAMSIVAFSLGARIIEKHFTLDRTMKGTDHAFSLEPHGMRRLVRDLENAHVALGDPIKRVLPPEMAAREKMGKKLIYSRDLHVGDVIGLNELELRSPGDGIAPSEMRRFVGKRLCQDVSQYDDLKESHFD